MSRIQELIKEMCPNGVQYYVLDDIADTFIGLATSVTKYKEKEGIVLLHNSDIRQNKIILKSIEFISKDFADKNKGKYHRLNDIVTVHTGDVGTSAVISKEYVGSMGFTTLVTRIRNFNLINPHYLCYYFNSDICKRDIARVTISDRSNLNQKEFCKLRIPIPPLEVQEEIVRILDKFGELEAELEAELEVRKNQYEFWREKLLTSTNKYKLGDIAKFTYGFTDKTLDFGDARYIRITDITEDGSLSNNDCKYLNITNANSKYVLNKGDIVVARTGASFGKTLYFNGDFPSIYASFLIKIELDNEIILNRYYWHFSKSSLYWNQANNLVSKAGQPQFNSNAIKKIEIPLPSLEEQKRIINILDKFDKLVNDISEGLPAEIGLRKKQYEYYRNKLLSFEELS